MKIEYLGSNPKSHDKIVAFGCTLGLQQSRKRTIGENIARIAQKGHERALNFCRSNPENFAIYEEGGEN